MRNNHVIALITVIISAVFFLYALIGFANKSYPVIGQDFEYFIPRLLDVYLHYKVNGLSIQWYTPTFGSGIPAYPNPQHVQFTLPALLMGFMGPWNAIWVSYGIFISAGFVSSYLLFKDIFEFDPLASALGSMGMNANGFVFSHAIMGHLGYQAFSLLPLILLCLFHPKIRPIVRGVFLAFIFSINIHNGGFYVIVIYIFSLLITIPVLMVIRSNLFVWKSFWQTLSATILLTLFFSGSKLYAISSFMNWFPRHVEDHYTVSLFQALYGILLQLFGTSTVVIIKGLLGTTDFTDYFTSTMFSYGGGYGLWEFDLGISPAILIICGLLPVFYFFNQRRKKIAPKTLLLLALSLLGLWLTTEFRLTTGIVYPYIRHLQVIKSLHVNLRFAAAYLLPLSTLFAFGVNYIQARLRPQTYTLTFIILAVVTLIPIINYITFPVNYYVFSFENSQTDKIYKAIRTGETFSIKSNNIEILDIETFQNHATSLKPYEPIFGYDLESFHPLTHPGPVLEVNNNYFNMTNPASLVFPEENNLVVFEKISTSEQEKLQQFVSHKQPAWKRPLIQNILDILMICSIILTTLYVITHGIQNVWKEMKTRISDTRES